MSATSCFASFICAFVGGISYPCRIARYCAFSFSADSAALYRWSFSFAVYRWLEKS